MTTRFNTALHLRLMWEADTWVRHCYTTGVNVLDCNGERGDLYFLLSAFEAKFMASVLLCHARTWQIYSTTR